MQRVEPRQVENAPPQGEEGPGGQWQVPTGFASTGREAHTQSFEEIYGVPENFLEIEVWHSTPRTGLAEGREINAARPKAC